MKIIKFSTLAILFAALVVLSACKDDSDDDVSAFVGSYTISNAELAEGINLTTVEVPPGVFPVPAGTDITTQIHESLLSSVECSSSSNAYVELRKDFSIYMSCAGDNELNAGTWSEENDSTLILSMNSTAIPPNGFVLTVGGIEQTETGMRGKTTVPFPKEIFALMLQGFGLTLAAETPAYIPVVFFIDFAKQ